jgi:putative oxidoreductase
MRFVVLAGRILYSLIFITSGFNHFKAQTIQHGASHGVIMPNFLIPAAGVLAIIGGLSIAFGFKTKIGAWMIVAFLVPVTLTMHNFWAIDDPMQHMTQMIMFMKNTSMLGGALLIAYFGAGPVSLDERKMHHPL